MSLAGYINEMVAILAREEPATHERLRYVTGNRMAKIGLDDETVLVTFQGPDLLFLPIEETADERSSTGEGRTDAKTVLDILDGYLEVTEAILSGRLQAQGSQEDLDRILVAVELLLDASARIPELRALAARFRVERQQGDMQSVITNVPSDASADDRDEFEMLARLDLLS